MSLSYGPLRLAVQRVFSSGLCPCVRWEPWALAGGSPGRQGCPHPARPCPPGTGACLPGRGARLPHLLSRRAEPTARRCRLSSGVPSLCLLINSLELLFPGTRRPRDLPGSAPRRPDPGPLPVASRAPSPGGISALRVLAATLQVLALSVGLCLESRARGVPRPCSFSAWLPLGWQFCASGTDGGLRPFFRKRGLVLGHSCPDPRQPDPRCFLFCVIYLSGECLPGLRLVHSFRP